MDNLNGINKLLVENNIGDPQSLLFDQDVLDSICYKALRIYELFSTLEGLFETPFRFGDHRAQLAHITKRVRNKNLTGFDEIKPGELWRENFESALPEIKNEVDQVLRDKPRLLEAIQNLSDNEVTPPIRLLEASDVTHHAVIKDIQDKWKEVAVCAVTLLHLMSQGTSPPPFEKLVRYVGALVGGTREETEHALQPLVDREILSRSSSERYLFVEDRVFAMNVTRDFLEQGDLEVVLETIRRLEDDN